MVEPYVGRLFDAAAGGLAELDTRGRVVSVSGGFAQLCGLEGDARGEPLGRLLPEFAELLACLELDERPESPPRSLRAELVKIGRDGVARELRVILDSDATGVRLAVCDESRLFSQGRREAALGREVGQLREALERLEAAPVRARVLAVGEGAARLGDVVARARRYRFAVTLLSVKTDVEEVGVGHLLLECVRGVDDVGLTGEPGAWVAILPHTDVTGGKVVADRFVEAAQTRFARRAAVGVAQLATDEGPSSWLERARGARERASTRGGGVLLAVDVL